MKEENKPDEILTRADIQTAVYALESWLDAFGDDEENDADVIRVKKVMRKMQQALKGPTATVKTEIH